MSKENLKKITKIEKFNWSFFKTYVNTYDPKKHGADNPDIIFEDMIYGLGVSIDDENFKYGKGYNLFKLFLSLYTKVRIYFRN